MSVKATNNAKKVLQTLQDNIPVALEAMGIAAVGMTTRQMQTGYNRPIWRTGDLQRDVQYETDPATDTVRIGNTLHYGKYVHDGTYKMVGRPYLNDTFLNQINISRLGEIAADALSTDLEGGESQ